MRSPSKWTVVKWAFSNYVHHCCLCKLTPSWAVVRALLRWINAEIAWLYRSSSTVRGHPRPSLGRPLRRRRSTGGRLTTARRPYCVTGRHGTKQTQRARAENVTRRDRDRPDNDSLHVQTMIHMVKSQHKWLENARVINRLKSINSTLTSRQHQV